MNIVTLEPADIPELLEIQSECGLGSWTAAGYQVEIKKPDSIIIGARDADGSISGFIVGRLGIATGSESSEAEIYNIGTRTRARQRGVGSALLKRFVQICRDRGVEAVWLEVRTGNDQAINFYTNRGFEAVDTRRNFYSDPVEDASVMVLRFGSSGV